MNTVFHQTEKWIKKHYHVRYNEIALLFEWKSLKEKKWKHLNEHKLYVEIQKNGIKISIQNLMALLKSDFCTRYNPIKEYFENLPKWEEPHVDHIAQLAACVKASDQEQFAYHLKKWLVRTVKCAIHENYFNKQAFIVIDRKQNSGKTSFCRYFCPLELSDYIAEDVPNDKDARILVAKNFLINLDELAYLSRRETNSLKSLFSKVQINERLPYESKNTIIPRIASFIGSTNQDAFLNDETGSVRWLCFAIKEINWKYSKTPVSKIWAQAYALAQNPSFLAELTIEDIKENEARNRKYQQLSVEQELISKYIRKGTQFMTATDVMLHIKQVFPRLNKIQVGKALTSLGFERVKDSSSQTYGYLLETLPLFEEPVIYSSEESRRIDLMA